MGTGPLNGVARDDYPAWLRSLVIARGAVDDAAPGHGGGKEVVGDGDILRGRPLECSALHTDC